MHSGQNILKHSQLEVRTNSNDLFILGTIHLVKFISGMEWDTAIFGAKIAKKDQCNLWRVPFMDTPEEVHSYLSFRQTQ